MNIRHQILFSKLSVDLKNRVSTKFQDIQEFKRYDYSGGQSLRDAFNFQKSKEGFHYWNDVATHIEECNKVRNERIERLIEIVKNYKGFDMKSMHNCVIGLAYRKVAKKGKIFTTFIHNMLGLTSEHEMKAIKWFAKHYMLSVKDAFKIYEKRGNKPDIINMLKSRMAYDG